MRERYALYETYYKCVPTCKTRNINNYSVLSIHYRGTTERKKNGKKNLKIRRQPLSTTESREFGPRNAHGRRNDETALHYY